MSGYEKIEHASLTDVGIRRSHNQDSHAVLLAGDAEQWQKRGHVFLVADGMGAHAVGELASELAASIIPHTYHKYAEKGAVAALEKAFVEANASIHARGQQNREFEGMGTTTSVLVLRADGAWIGHVGDSRVYRLRGGRIEQLSFDHSLLWEMARRQKMKPEEVQGIPANVLIRSLGPEENVKPDIAGPYAMKTGDTFVLCSDGLSGPLTDHEIGAVAGVLPPAEACQFLVELANLRGGPDNITVLVIRVEEGSGEGEAAAEDLGPRKSLFSSFTWPIAILFLGLLLAGGAVNLAVRGLPGEGLVFVLAILTLLTGLVGLVFTYWKEQHSPSGPDYRPRVHRQLPCPIDRSLLEKLLKLEAVLVQQAREKQLDTDWEVHQEHHQLAEKFRTGGDLDAAFREFCRAILPLTEAFHRHRNKAEVFQPLWDRTRNL